MPQLSKRESRLRWKEASRNVNMSVVLENVMYATNVASIFRTSEAAGVTKIYLTGFSQKPPFGKDLKKTSRSSEGRLYWEYDENVDKMFVKIRNEGTYVIGVEIADEAIPHSELPKVLKGKEKVCFVFGNEAHGMSKKALSYCDTVIYIPQYGKNTSLNVSVSAGIILFGF